MNNTITTFFMQLLCLCEAESLSYLDEVANSSQSLDLAKSVALEVSFQHIAYYDANMLRITVSSVCGLLLIIG